MVWNQPKPDKQRRTDPIILAFIDASCIMHPVIIYQAIKKFRETRVATLERKYDVLLLYVLSI